MYVLIDFVLYSLKANMNETIGREHPKRTYYIDQIGDKYIKEGPNSK